jgi:hypothetical protein
MQDYIQITDREWERISRSSFRADDFIKALDGFDSIRNVAGSGEFASIVYGDIQKLKELARKVFLDGDRDSAGEMFSICSSLNKLTASMYEDLSEIRIELESMNELTPRGKGHK